MSRQRVFCQPALHSLLKCSSGRLLPAFRATSSRCPSGQGRGYHASYPLLKSKPITIKPQQSVKAAASQPAHSSSKLPNRTSTSKLGTSPTYRSFAETMALKRSPTLLYQAPPHTAYFVGSYAFGIFCLSYAGWNFYNHYLYPPEGLAVWVPIAFGGVCFFMACFGTWLMLAPTRLIRTITAVPIPNSSPPSILMRVEIRRMLALPFRKPHYFEVKPSDLSLTNPLYEQPKTNTLHPAERFRQEEERRRTQKPRGFFAPFRQFGAMVRRSGRSLVKVWTRRGFVKMQIKGKSGMFKLDRDGGWTLDEGRSIDRLVRVKVS